MADHSIKKLGIELASSLLAGAISVAAATGAGASTCLTGGAVHSYVYNREQPVVGCWRQLGARLLSG
jgi:hypothetical protein